MRVRGYNNAGRTVQTGLCAYRILKKKTTHTHTHPFPSPLQKYNSLPLSLPCNKSLHDWSQTKLVILYSSRRRPDFKCRLFSSSTGVIVGRKGCTCTHVQYSRLDSSGQNLESNGVWSKNETGSTVESTRVTGSLVIRWNRKCKEYFERKVRSRPMESIGSTGNTSIPMESPEI